MPKTLSSRIFEERKVLHIQRPSLKARNLRAVFVSALAALVLAGLAASPAEGRDCAEGTASGDARDLDQRGGRRQLFHR